MLQNHICIRLPVAVTCHCHLLPVAITTIEAAIITVIVVATHCHHVAISTAFAHHRHCPLLLSPIAAAITIDDNVTLAVTFVMDVAAAVADAAIIHP